MTAPRCDWCEELMEDAGLCSACRGLDRAVDYDEGRMLGVVFALARSLTPDRGAALRNRVVAALRAAGYDLPLRGDAA